MKQKPKHNILKKALTLVGALTTLTALTTTSLAAVWSQGEGNLVTASGSGYAWGTLGSTAANSWRVTLYVSTKDDGTINPTTDTIEGPSLAKVGTIVYNNIKKGYAFIIVRYIPILSSKIIFIL